MNRLAFVLLFCSAATFAQQKVQILDAITQTAIPFSKITPTPGSPFLADLDGYFTIPAGTDSVGLKSYGYRDTTYAVSTIGDKVLMQPDARELEEVVIVPGVNPAIRIMELAIGNRKANHPMGDESFTYNSYSKFVFTLDPEALTQIPDTTSDTTLQSLRSFFTEQHLFMMESAAKKSFDPPYREKEEITAYKVSGFSDPAFSTFSNELQSFNFYENQFNLLGHSYINPLAFGSIRRYVFILEDETVVGGDTTWTIRFYPRKDKNFDGMKGYLYINSNGYALEKVIAEPAEKSDNIEPKIIQEYTLVDGKKWFPYKLSTEAVFPAFRVSKDLENGYLIGKGSTYIEDIKLGADLSDKKFNAVTLETAVDAGEKDSVYWENQRKYQLTPQEERTYVMIDSLSEAENFDQKLAILTSLASGKIPVGYVQFDIRRFVYFRKYEGYRIGAGLETSKKLMKNATAGGYFGYGTRDKQWKYGGYAKWMIIPAQFVEIQGLFQEDLLERGGVKFLSEEAGLSLNNLGRDLYIANMERQRKAEFIVSGYVTPRLKWLVNANYQRIRLTDGYGFTAENGLVYSPDHAFDLAESGVELVWTIREKLMYLGTKRVSMGTKWPRLTAKAVKGWSGIENSEFDYLRLNLSIQQDILIRAAGKLSYMVSAGKTIGDVPLTVTQMPLGTGGNWNISVLNSFETVLPASFFNREQINVFTRFTFRPVKTGLKWTAPQLGIHHAMGTGSFSGKERHSIAFRSMDKGYYEAGLILDKVLILNTTGLGIGAFYNYGYYSVPQAEKNVTVKVAVSFVL